MRVKMTVAVAALAALLLGLPASSYAHRTVEVKAGESIQAAIDKAKPYTTIEVAAGTYKESLLIKTDGIELQGAGRKATKIVPPDNTPAPGRNCVDPDSGTPNGICVFDVNENFEPNHTVKDVEISHLQVTGFGGIGIFFVFTKNGEVTRTITSNNDEYGIFFNSSTGGQITRNVTGQDDAAKAPEAGIYVGDSPNANATVWKNVSYGNVFGLFIRDAAHGKVLNNKTFSNCVGIVFLNTDEADVPPGQTPGPSVDVKDWLAQGNNVTANNKECAGGGEEPPFSGIGIGVVSAIDVRLIDNGVFGNKAAGPPAGPFPSAGILIVSDAFQATTGAKVGFNTAFGNATDLIWDEAQGSSAKFFANDCLTSQPDGLCEDPDTTGDNGDNGNGDHGDDGGHSGSNGDHADHKKNDKKKHKKHRKHKKHHKHQHHN